ncbi:DISARM system SNF2-like helicase DrmD [Thermocoleostomius sinensis]|uniref:DISARM system SNF2-like helicase DrmD n=1 Tax=Thermocoleostomius sinensis A174 TaxID=2016057 RepID=A0A9E9CCB3_9CYAN|nr:DISARM system SNF2-like helicase DrmD [Thermocoleostomius sinensis]WAL62465.1 DISARM system SNF2-like helicase DrmD [Thermocoleostomius sinensis A174]
MTAVEVGSIVRVRSRQYLVEDVLETHTPQEDTRVRLACLDDDALGETLEILWEREVDARYIGTASWESVAARGFDNPKLFSAYLHTLRWSCVTSTDPKLFQAPYRAGIEVKAYQLEPLRKALLMPRVGLFIADDVGLGKTIEAGLILREMLMRQKVRRVVISCPPSVVRQWQEEMESRFGLTFLIVDREFVASRRRERGYSINPWTTHTRFIISHALLRDETYAAPLRDWLGEFSAGAMLILDEAHNAAPASGAKYAIDSQLTRTVRDLAPRFEHKLFLSATPHNGHSNSFAALLEILDPQRFCRGVPVRNRKLLDAVMVRRLKSDLREIGDDFPERIVVRMSIDGLPSDAPELQLSRLLQAYRQLREERLKVAPKSTQRAAALVLLSLQKRLLSSIEAFARTLKVHQTAIAKHSGEVLIAKQAKQASSPLAETKNRNSLSFPLLQESAGADDDRAELTEDEVEAEENAQMRVATEQDASIPSARELELLDEMTQIANAARHLPDPRIQKLAQWIQDNQCPELGTDGATWNDRRVIIFTEYTDTKRYLQQQLQAIIAGSDQERQRIAVFHGGMGDDRREEIKLAFNSDPAKHPLRILIATDAAREGVNLQNHCADLFHFDLPWNPSRLEQRNGRIDRKLQRSPVVYCHYFVFSQRTEDRVLDTLLRKTDIIQRELGSLSLVLERNVNQLLADGIQHGEAARLEAAIAKADQTDESSFNAEMISEELEQVRLRRQELEQQNALLQGMLSESQKWLGLDDRHFRDAISASLEILGANSLQPVDPNEAAYEPATAKWDIPALDQRFGADPTWATTLDTLRAPRKRGQKLWDWRRESPIRPVVFRDPGSLDGEVVHLHLEHRIVQRLLSRFLAQGFLHDELTRACVCLTDRPILSVVVLGRLSLYGDRASRLHDEVIAVAAEWIAPEARGRSKLRPLGEGEKDNVLQVLETSLASPRLHQVPESVQQRLRQAAAQDVEELRPHLDRRAAVLIERAQKKLQARGQKEAEEMQAILEEQRDRILKRQKETAGNLQLSLFAEAEAQQLEADRRHWERRLQSLEVELISEPARIKAAYQVKAVRIEPVGLVYLQPVSG